MKTDELIAALAADNASVSPPISRTLLLALAVGALLAAAHFVSLLPVRSDFAHAITHDLRFVFKFVFTLAIAIPALVLVTQLARPDGADLRSVWMIGVPLALLALAVGYEMLTVPADHWQVHAVGSMSMACMTYIPILAAAPFVALLYALRNGAPAHPAAAGAAAGLVSGAIAASFYAAHCIDDSPMFLAIWYVIGIGFVTALGALIGSRLLRW